jgi:hypothetical protein
MLNEARIWFLTSRAAFRVLKIIVFRSAGLEREEDFLNSFNFYEHIMSCH